jgi:hypothetical protein
MHISRRRKRIAIKKYMRRFVAHIQGQEPWQGKHSDKDFIGLQHKVIAKK